MYAQRRSYQDCMETVKDTVAGGGCPPEVCVCVCVCVCEGVVERLVRRRRAATNREEAVRGKT